MTKGTKIARAWPWLLGMTLGLLAAASYLGVQTAGATGDDAVVFEVDPSRELTRDDLAELIRFARANEGRDVILQPAPGYQVPAGQTRRLRDELRTTREAEELERHLAQGYADGTYVTGAAERAPCAGTRARLVAGPGRHLLCEGEVVAASARIPFLRATTPGQVESLLEEHVHDLLAGVSPEEEAQGFFSYFSSPAALTAVTLSAEGAVELDFNSLIADQIGHVHPGYATHTLLQQIYRTLFQFRDVSSVRLTLDGSCDAFGDLIGGPCQKLDRELWEQMLYDNGDSVDFFNLKGGN